MTSSPIRRFVSHALAPGQVDRCEKRLGRLRWLSGARALLAAAVLGGLMLHGSALPRIGEATIAVLHASSTRTPFLRHAVRRRHVEAVASTALSSGIGLGAVLLSAVLWHFVLLFAWTIWNAVESQRALLPRPRGHPLRRLGALPLAVASLVPVAVMISGPRTVANAAMAVAAGWPLVEATGAIVVAAAVTCLVLTIVVLPSVRVWRSRRRLERVRR